jgi:iron complex outermembrane receptor protein
MGWQKAVNKNWDLDLYFGINNLFDTTYASMILINAGSFGGSQPRYYYPGLPRNIFGGVKINYRW